MNVPEEEALFVQKQMWWSDFLKEEINELGFTEQEIFFPNDLVVKKLVNLNTPFIETLNINGDYCSMWVFVPYDKYRYVLDIKMKNMFNNTLARIQMRKRKFLFNYEDTGVELSLTSLSEGFWFHIETSFTSSNASLFISGAGLTESITSDLICGNTCNNHTKVQNIQFIQPEQRRTGSNVALHDIRILQ